MPLFINYILTNDFNVRLFSLTTEANIRPFLTTQLRWSIRKRFHCVALRFVAERPV